MIFSLFSILIPRGVSAFGTLFLTILVPIYFSVDISATFFTEFALTYFISIGLGLGLKTSLLKSRSQCFYEDNKKANLIDYLIILFPLCFIVFITFILGKDFSKYWYYYAAPLLASFGILTAYLRASGYEIWAALTEVGTISLLTSIVIILSVLFNSGNTDLGYIYLCTAILFLLLNLICMFIVFGVDMGNTIEGYKISKRESFYFLFIDLIAYTTQWFPLFYLNSMGGKYVIYYTLANRLSTIIGFVAITIDAYASPRFSNMWINNHKADLVLFKNKVKYLSKVAGIIIFCILLIVSYIFMIYQHYDIDFYLYCFVFILAFSFSLSLGPNASFLMMTQSEAYILKINLSMLVIVVLSSSLFFYLELPVYMAFSASIPVVIRSLYYNQAVKNKL